nr:hypothetical protein [Tanacetum cinerariifolium]GEZ60701.1 hypothetical protein [Tanacetum cinerariifolium]
MRIVPTMTQKEPTYQLVLDALALTPCYPAFLIIAEICPRLPNQEFVEPPSSDAEIVPFIKELGYKGDIEYVIEVFTDHMHQPWRTFTAIINGCLSGKTTGLDMIRLSRAQIMWGMFYNNNVDYVELLWEDFMFQIDNRNTSAARKENIPYPRFTKAIIHHFISKDKSISMRNKQETANQQMLDSPTYKTYLAFSTGAATPKKARKWKKPTSPTKKKTLVADEEPVKKPAKKPATKPDARKQSTGVQIRETTEVSVSKKKVGGSGDGAGLEPEVHDEQKVKSIDTHEGTSIKPWVPDVSKADSLESEYESWGVSNDDDDDDQQSDDERTESDDDKH